MEMNVRVLHQPIGTVVQKPSHVLLEEETVITMSNAKVVWFVVLTTVLETSHQMDTIQSGQVVQTVAEVIV